MTVAQTHSQGWVEVKRGLAIGKRFPTVTLPDQSGRLVDLNAVRGSRPALVLFDRSILW